MRYILIVFLFISFSSLSQEQMSLSVKANDHISEQFYLLKGDDVGIVTIDSSRVKAFGLLLFNWEGEPGVYRLSDKNGHLVDFRMEKSQLSFEIKGNFEETELIFESGNKNNQLQYYISEFQYYKQEASRLAGDYQKAEASALDTKDLVKTYKETQREYKDLAKDLWSKRADDWSLKLALSYADLMPDLNQKNKSRFFVDQYFQYFDFTDTLLVGTPDFYNKLERFFETKEIQTLLKRNVSKEIDLMIQQIFWLSEVNKYAQECLVNYLMQTYPEDSFPNLYATIVKTYKLANSCEYVLANKSMRTRMENDKNFSVGAKAPDFILPNSMSINIESLSKVNSDLTLLIAWSAHCDGSVDLLDKIQDLYHTYHEKGLEVVAISIDNNIRSWEHFVEDRAYTWVNACDKAGLKGEFAEAYNITSTPVMFLVSTDLKLISKPITFYELKAAVANYLD
ncbi:peroxiredoxin family protein [Ancylomarina sp. YFZ004]